jgi:hypothetical protein
VTGCCFRSAQAAGAPHLWVAARGRRRSTLDLFDGRLTLVVGRRGRGWRRAAAHLAGTGLPIVALSVGRELADPDGRLALRFGLGDSGAVLVRPDGVVAWRSDAAAAHPHPTLAGAVGIALGNRDALADALAG